MERFSSLIFDLFNPTWVKSIFVSIINRIDTQCRFMILKRRNKMNRVQHEMVNGENNPTPTPPQLVSTSHRESYSAHFPRDRVNQRNDFFHMGDR